MPAIVSPPPPLQDTVHFNCQSCDSTLEVPLEFLGVSGPCPFCGGTATAPTLEEWENLHRPPVPEPLPVSQPVRPAEVSMPGTRKKGLQGLKERFRRSRRQKIDASGPSLAQILGWATVSLTVVAAGFAISVVKFTVPTNPPARSYDMPKDLTIQVMREKERLEQVRATFINQAAAAAKTFLAEGSVAVAQGKISLFSLQSAVPTFEGNLFPDLKPEDLEAQSCVRKPGTEEFLVTVEPKDGRGPVLLVEQRDGKPVIHADAFHQQVEDSLSQFHTAPENATTLAYVMARFSQVQLALPGLDEWPKVEILSPFPTENPKGFIACVAPGSDAAALVQKRRGTAHWNRAVMEFRWSKTSEGNRFIELIQIHPNAWAKF